MFCQIIEEELQEPTRVVLTSEHFVAVELFASPAPFFTHIYPRRQMASFGYINAKEIADLGRVSTIVAKLYYGWQNPDFHFTITAPAECVGIRVFHWYISVIPRLTRTAGFDLGSGMSSTRLFPKRLLSSCGT